MPRVGYVEKTIFNIEGINVDFIKDRKNLRSEVQLPYNYSAAKATKNSYNVTEFKNKLKRSFPGFDFNVYDGSGNNARGNMLLSSLRVTYLED